MEEITKSPYESIISKPEVSFWVPIVFTAVTITISFMALTSKVDLLSQKIDTVIENQTTIIVAQNSTEREMESHSISIGIINSKLNIR